MADEGVDEVQERGGDADADMIVPARTNNGIASSTGLPNCWNPQSIMPFIVTSPMKYITISAAPKQ